MITLIGSVIGFISSFAPSILGYFSEGRDQKHEALLMDKQLAQQQAIAVTKFNTTIVESEGAQIQALYKNDAKVVSKSSQWVIDLAASVRPVITYIFFFEFLLLTVAMFFGWVTAEQYQIIWNEPTEAMFSIIISFWFGQRLVQKLKER